MIPLSSDCYYLTLAGLTLTGYERQLMLRCFYLVDPEPEQGQL